MEQGGQLLFDVEQDIEDFRLNLDEELELARASGHDGYKEFLDAIEIEKRRLEQVIDVSAGALRTDIEAKIVAMASKVRELTKQSLDSNWTGDQLVRARSLWNSMQMYKRSSRDRVEWLY